MTTDASLAAATDRRSSMLRTLIGWHFLYEGYIKLPASGLGSRRRPARGVVVGGATEGGNGAAAALFHSLG